MLRSWKLPCSSFTQLDDYAKLKMPKTERSIELCMIFARVIIKIELHSISETLAHGQAYELCIKAWS